MLSITTIVGQMPYPIASVYADLGDPNASPQTKREAVYFTCYQLMRTVGLTLVGQYLMRDLPSESPLKARDKLNRSIAGVRAPFFSDWIALLNGLNGNCNVLKLDFFAEFSDTMAAVKKNRVDIPESFKGHDGRFQNLTCFEALLALRNSAAHSGMSRDDVCREAVVVFQPHLNQLLLEFAFLSKYELLTLRSFLDAEPCMVQVMRGPQPAAQEPCELSDALYAAFKDSPVIMRAPSGEVQALFPLFHGHLAGEPLRAYDGHYLRDDPKMARRTIYYLGNSQRLPLEDSTAHSLVQPPASPFAAERLGGLLAARQIPWHLKREEVAPWSLRDIVRDYARHTLEGLKGIKYLPSCYLDRSSLSNALWHLATADQTPYRAILFSGRAGSGKTSLLCDAVRRFLEDVQHEEHLIFFVRGDGLTAEIEGSNLLLANLLYKIGLRPTQFATFAEFFAFLESKRKDDRLADRRFVIVLDAVNEAQRSTQVMIEALEMVAVAREHDWLRIILSVREEFLLVWRGRRGQLAGNPFYPLRSLFVLPPENRQRPVRPEDPPAWFVPPFTVQEAEAVYRQYQTAHAVGNAGVPACRTPWERIQPTTRTELLTLPLHLDLWMRAFDGKEAPALSGAVELFEAYVADLRDRFDFFWESMAAVFDYMLEQGRMELSDEDTHEIEAGWHRRLSKEQIRLRFSPLELACASGVMQKRTTEEGGGYRIPHQRLREVLLYLHLKDVDPQLDSNSLRAWLALPEMAELEGALAQVARDLWAQDRTADLALFMNSDHGARSVERMLARCLEMHEETHSLKRRTCSVLSELAEDYAASRRMQELVTFNVPNRVAGLPVAMFLRAFWEAALPWCEKRQLLYPDDKDSLRDLGVAYFQMSELYSILGDSQRAMMCFEKSHQIKDRLHAAYTKGHSPSRLFLAVTCAIITVALPLTAYAVAQRKWVYAFAILLGALTNLLNYFSYRKRIAKAQNYTPARDMADSWIQLADLYYVQGKGRRALQLYKKGLEIQKRLQSLDPKCADLTRGVSLSLERLGTLYFNQGQNKLAVKFYEESLEIAERLHAAEPQTLKRALDLSVSYLHLADVYQRLRESHRALEYYEQSLRLMSPLHAAEPQRVDLALQLSRSQAGLGEVYRDLGNGEKALTLHAEALDILERLCAAEPDRSDVACVMTVTYRKMGDCYLSSSQSQRALECFEKARKILEGLYAAEPGRVDLFAELVSLYPVIANVYRSLGDRLRAIELFGRGIELLAVKPVARSSDADLIRFNLSKFDIVVEQLLEFGENREEMNLYRKIFPSLSLDEQEELLEKLKTELLALESLQ